jgi:hypothetical protein
LLGGGHFDHRAALGGEFQVGEFIGAALAQKLVQGMPQAA